ncbi:MAG TPA: potassium/proton antiporter [Ohtaekwangia sp.]
MSLSPENILLFGSVLLFLSIIASKTSGKFGIPTLILFLIIGMLAGSEGIGGIYFNEPKTAQFLGVISLTFILFSGGLETKIESIRPIIWDGISLATIGTLITAVSVGIFSTYVLDFTIPEGLLLGAIVSSTDAAAVFSVLRFRKVGLKGTLRPLLEFESGSNDPMAYFLTISFISLVQQPDASMLSFIPKFLVGMAIGAICGYAFGKLMVFIVNRIKLDIDGLYPVLVLAMVFFAYSFTEVIGGNAFLTVYIVGIILGNSNFIHKKSLIRFYDGQAWLMQIVMFVTLGLLVFPKQIVPIIPQGIIISLFLIFAARPLSVFISLSFAKDLNFRKKLFLSWVGLRGAAPIIFATYPLLAGVENANTIFHLVFFISASSVLLQGTTLPIMAKWLHVNVPEKIKRKFPLDIELKEDFKSVLIELDVPDTSPAIGKAIVEMNLPKSALIVLIHRHDKYITPSGDTVIEGKDHLLVMAGSRETAERVYSSFGMVPH